MDPIAEKSEYEEVEKFLKDLGFQKHLEFSKVIV